MPQSDDRELPVQRPDRRFVLKGASFGFLGMAAACGRETRAQTAVPKLDDFAGVRLQARRWSNPWTPSDWAESKLHGVVWSPRNATIEGGDLVLRLGEGRTAQVQASDRSFARQASFVVDATLPAMRPGLIAAPLWLYNRETRDEIDFEVIGRRGLMATIYRQGRAVWSQMLEPGDLTARRLRLEIQYRAGERAVFSIDGRERATVTAAGLADGFPASPLKPYMELWPSGAETWAGRWRPPASGEFLVLRIHGFNQKPDA